MLGVRYKGYVLSLCLASDNNAASGLSPVVKISTGETCNPMATLYPAASIRTERESIIRGFELGANWIDKTLPQLCGSEVVLIRETVANNLAHARHIIAELHAEIAASHHCIHRSEELVLRSHNVTLQFNN